jgi:hypothetical protein
MTAAITRDDLNGALADLRRDIGRDIELAGEKLRSEFRADTVTHVRWLAGLFIVQFIATVGATTGLVSVLLNARLP